MMDATSAKGEKTILNERDKITMEAIKDVRQVGDDLLKSYQKTRVIGQSGGGMVRVFTGENGGGISKVKIDFTIEDTNDIPMLEDLICAAINDVNMKAKAIVEKLDKQALMKIEVIKRRAVYRLEKTGDL